MVAPGELDGSHSMRTLLPCIVCPLTADVSITSSESAIVFFICKLGFNDSLLNHLQVVGKNVHNLIGVADQIAVHVDNIAAIKSISHVQQYLG